jgi:hypothetical protein
VTRQFNGAVLRFLRPHKSDLMVFADRKRIGGINCLLVMNPLKLLPHSLPIKNDIYTSGIRSCPLIEYDAILCWNRMI